MSTNTTNPTPLGTLIKLPLELRDQIYEHVFHERYVVLWNSHEGYPYSDGNNPTAFSDFGIRFVSKAVSAEASARLFSNATVFEFYVGFHIDDKLSAPPPRTVTEKMRNVAFMIHSGAGLEGEFIRLVEDNWAFYQRGMWGEEIIPMVTADGEVKGRQTIYNSARVDPRCEVSVDHFTGIEIERDNLLVTFEDFDENFQLFMATRFFQTLKMCVGFRTITVELEWWDYEDTIVEVKLVEEKVREVQMELEQCWGPCVVRKLPKKLSGSTTDTMYFRFELAFQPLKFRGENMKAAGAAVVKEADRLNEVS